MKIDKELLHRFKLFGGGFSIGIIILLFIFNGKKHNVTGFQTTEY